MSKRRYTQGKRKRSPILFALLCALLLTALTAVGARAETIAAAQRRLGLGGQRSLARALDLAAAVRAVERDGVAAAFAEQAERKRGDHRQDDQNEQDREDQKKLFVLEHVFHLPQRIVKLPPSRT